MKRAFRSIAIAAGAAVALTACTPANWNSISRSYDPSEGESRLVDAKQRGINAVLKPVLDENGQPVTYPGFFGRPKVVTTPAVCAEPSPDALQATATALAGSSEAAKGALSVALQASLSSSEGAGSFGLRTQTIQLLRDAYYRLCEAAQSDGLDSIDFGIMQRLFQNHIIALLAVEQLTGAVVGSQTALGSAARSEVAPPLAALRTELTLQRDELEEAKADKAAADVVAAQREADIAKLDQLIDAAPAGQSPSDADAPPSLDGATPSQAPAGPTKADLETQRAQAVIERDRATAAAASAETRITFHQEQFDLLNKTFAEAAEQTTNTGAAGVASLLAGTSGREAVPANVVNAVRAITINAMNQDYETDLCLQSLRFKNYNAAFKGRSMPGVSAADVGDRAAFLRFCEEVLFRHAEMLAARNNAIMTRNDAMRAIVHAATRENEKARLGAVDARNLLLALDFATTEGAESYLSSSVNFTDPNGTTTEQNRGAAPSPRASARPKPRPEGERVAVGAEPGRVDVRVASPGASASNEGVTPISEKADALITLSGDMEELKDASLSPVGAGESPAAKQAMVQEALSDLLGNIDAAFDVFDGDPAFTPQRRDRLTELALSVAIQVAPEPALVEAADTAFDEVLREIAAP